MSAEIHQFVFRRKHLSFKSEIIHDMIDIKDHTMYCEAMIRKHHKIDRSNY